MNWELIIAWIVGPIVIICLIARLWLGEESNKKGNENMEPIFSQIAPKKNDAGSLHQVWLQKEEGWEWVDAVFVHNGKQWIRFDHGMSKDNTSAMFCSEPPPAHDSYQGYSLWVQRDGPHSFPVALYFKTKSAGWMKFEVAKIQPCTHICQEHK